jgi:hypothetical protein
MPGLLNSIVVPFPPVVWKVMAPVEQLYRGATMVNEPVVGGATVVEVGGAMVSTKLVVACRLPGSVAVKVKVLWPAVVGVPDRVLAEKDSPAGSPLIE